MVLATNQVVFNWPAGLKTCLGLPLIYNVIYHGPRAMCSLWPVLGEEWEPGGRGVGLGEGWGNEKIDLPLPPNANTGPRLSALHFIHSVTYTVLSAYTQHYLYCLCLW